MRSSSSWSSFAFTLAMVLMVGCDSKSSPTTATSAKPSSNASSESSTEETPIIQPPEASANGQLTIGSTAPALDIQHWLSDGNGKFNEVTTFESGKVYVIEFWATWCGPCIGSMPHLAEVQESFTDQGVQIISISDEDPSTVNEFLSASYKGSKDAGDGPSTYGELTSVYCLTTDPDASVKEDYMRAARQNGIPCAFIVGKSGLIEWIGHPNGMEKPLQQVVDDKWDRENAAKAFVLKQKLERVQSDLMRLARQGNLEEARELLSLKKEELGEEFAQPLEYFETRLTMMSIQEMTQDGRTDEAIKEINTLRKTADKQNKPMLDMQLIQLLVQDKQYEKAASAIKDDLDEFPPGGLNVIAWGVYQHASDSNEIPDELRDAVIAIIEKALEEDPGNGAFLDTLAHLLHLGGDLDRALEVQSKAMENPGPAKKDIDAFHEQLLKEKKAADDS